MASPPPVAQGSDRARTTAVRDITIARRMNTFSAVGGPPRHAMKAVARRQYYDTIFNIMSPSAMPQAYQESHYRENAAYHEISRFNENAHTSRWA